MRFGGIDVGSLTAQAVIMEDGKIAGFGASGSSPTRWTRRRR